MEFSVGEAPSQKEFLTNLEEKMTDDYFTGDIAALLRPEEEYNQNEAFTLVRDSLINLM